MRGATRGRSMLGVALVVLGGCSVSSDDDAIKDRGAVEVASVVDGDTLAVRLPTGEVERVRLIGMNAPESGECFAEEASSMLEDLVAGETVVLTPDTSDRDQYGRLLRYASVDGVDIGEQLVEAGAAIARRYPPDTARAERYDQAQSRAETAEVGIWSSSACGPVPTTPTGASVAGGLVIGAIHFDAEGPDVDNLDDEWIRIDNVGDEPVDLTGWSVRDESSSNRYLFPDGFALGVGATVTLRTGCGIDTADTLHWCRSGSAVWNNVGDTAFLLDPAGNIAAFRSG